MYAGSWNGLQPFLIYRQILTVEGRRLPQGYSVEFYPGENKSRLKMGFPAFGSVPGKTEKKAFCHAGKWMGAATFPGAEAFKTILT